MDTERHDAHARRQGGKVRGGKERVHVSSVNIGRRCKGLWPHSAKGRCSMWASNSGATPERSAVFTCTWRHIIWTFRQRRSANAVSERKCPFRLLCHAGWPSTPRTNDGGSAAMVMQRIFRMSRRAFAANGRPRPRLWRHRKAMQGTASKGVCARSLSSWPRLCPPPSPSTAPDEGRRHNSPHCGA